MLKVQSRSFSCAIWKMDGANFQSWCCKLWPICNHQPPTLHSGARSHTPVFALNWEKRFVSRNCFNYFPPRQEARDRFDWCGKEESLCLRLSWGRDCTKSLRATGTSELMFLCKDRDENPTFEVEYNIDKRGYLCLGWKTLQRNCFQPLCDNQLGEDSEIGLVQSWKAFFVLQRGFVSSPNYFLLPILCMPSVIWKDDPYKQQNSNPWTFYSCTVFDDEILWLCTTI